ncbi:hypothetical protein NQ318_014618 [Aromia moschata]|uniref:DUF4817 domain-containing protein n=1 Tax=Aromia moschata TaxID=1265417 RepID=A0AAV8ZBB3_9CUCU|nr:hypothetical protein NQ318_014618 [Aromia moschata]
MMGWTLYGPTPVDSYSINLNKCIDIGLKFKDIDQNKTTNELYTVLVKIARVTGEISRGVLSCFYTAAKSRLVFTLYSEFETKCYFKLVKMSYLTESLKIEILMMIGYGDRARTQCELVRLFRETHPDLPPLNQGTISKIEAQYREMGHVRKVPSKRQAVVDDDTKLNLLLALEENQITPARQLARYSNLNHKTVLKILKYEKKII